MIQDLSGSWCIKGTGESMTRVDSPVPLMHHDPDRSWITDPNSDHPKGTQPKMICFCTVRVYNRPIIVGRIIYRVQRSKGQFDV